VVIVWDEAPDEALFKVTTMLAQTAPCPLLLFTPSGDSERIDQGIAAGIHAYVVGGYSRQRLRPLIHLAQARFKRERALQTELAELSDRFEERKLVDRAKGILMRAGQMSEDEAFRTLRSASMHGNRRVGQVSRRVIDAARAAEAINRAGQLRMLSQRIVKLQALIVAGAEVAGSRALLAHSVERVAANLATLEKLLSKATYGDLLDGVREVWARLHSALGNAADAAALAALDELAEQLLARADHLTTALEAAELGASLHVINVSGRQRMLSQRLAKQALLGGLLNGQAAADARGGAEVTAREFEQALDYLQTIPLATSETRAGLSTAAATWRRMVDGVAQAQTGPGRVALAAASEELLETFERLTDQYERSMQLLIGPVPGART
jgi:AmiR/NasT family two-component response regulator/nitrate/nitrite-specific signal transduction histidine kinase